ncbi:TRAF-type zinc finger domain-containing protein 1 isoform X2 [Corvus hawaiiensis]|uniref:TRAF-type zinc finger domain-containing protein 1 isoform X2 n=1 Tax=Corvus hawaiiensis TaxID=134902 RepID=UPI00201848AF|nr:TRAF-type zinc finger domain-containing protein 1 isoform X2 [Corvus hawaiiensis]
MAIAAVPAAESRLCGNCKKDIPAVNFIIHEIHCRRNIEICPYCSDSIPKSEMKNHIESEHVQVTCKCRMKMESSLLKDHEASSCPLRPVLCQFCDIQLAFNKLQEHELYCGARTEPCGRCGRNVLVRELKEHPRVCGREEKAAKGSRRAPGFGKEDGAVRSRPGADKDVIMLPCEFCEELCPAEDLILHQTGCNPASAFASFSKRSSSPNPWEYGGLQAGVSNSRRAVPSSQPQAVQAEGDIMIPCEFCGIQLEEEILFHHQHHCDLRPASPTGDIPARELPAPQPCGDRRESPEPARRRIRHQGDVSPWHTESFGKLGLCSAPGSRLRMETAKAGNAALSPPGRAGDAPATRGKPGKGNGSEGTPKDRGDSAAGTVPRVRPAQRFQAETFTSSSSRTSPAQPSSSTAGGRSLGLSDGRSGLRRRSSKAKAQSPAAGQAEE